MATDLEIESLKFRGYQFAAALYRYFKSNSQINKGCDSPFDLLAQMRVWPPIVESRCRLEQLYDPSKVKIFQSAHECRQRRRIRLNSRNRPKKLYCREQGLNCRPTLARLKGATCIHKARYEDSIWLYDIYNRAFS
jgi:hypothetical protein